MTRKLPGQIACTLPLKLDAIDDDEVAFQNLSPQPSILPVPYPSKSFWTHGTPGCNPLGREGSEGDLTSDVDICIIGSGITGVSCAYHLAHMSSSQKPLKIVILEARDFCSGATGRNGGHLTASLYSRMHELSELYGAQEAKKSFALERYTISSIVKIIENNGWAEDVDLVAGGHLSLVFTQEELRDIEQDLRAAEKAGVEGVENVELLDAQYVRQHYGTLHPAYRTPGYNLWPLKLVTKLYQSAQARPKAASLLQSLPQTSSSPNDTGSKQPFLSLHTHTPVLAVLPVSNSNRRWAIKTPRGIVSADYVVHATNAYASHLLPHLAGPSGIVPTRGQIVTTKSAVPREQLWNNGWGGNQGYEYWFARPCPASDRPLIILGGGRESSGPNFEYNIADDSSVNSKVSATLRAFLPAAFPGQFDNDTNPDMEWTGIMGFTRSHDPIVGSLSTPENRMQGMYIAAGYSGHGMPRAFACAEVVAQMILADRQDQKWTAPSWLPSWYLTPASGPAM
ncbi:hypothetical protein FRB94_005956 [Tulasnella sp. JGI-2019a]|nr:hypothetical protein FRB94_005956 [Tulasnella sp. JGI-2019a]